MEHLLADHKSNFKNNNKKLCEEKEHPFLSLMESQWKLR